MDASTELSIVEGRCNFDYTNEFTTAEVNIVCMAGNYDLCIPKYEL